MQYSIVNFNEIDVEDRIDAEYFKPDFISITNQLKMRDAEPLSNYAQITASAFYPAATHLYKEGDIPFMRCVDAISYPTISELQKDSVTRIPKWFLDEHKNIKRLHSKDIVITKVGTPCFASMVHDFEEVALSRTVAGLFDIKGIDPHYLVVFLRSKYGFEQLQRERELTIQYQLTLDRIGRIQIHKPSADFEKQIADLFKKSFNCYEKSLTLYRKAESELLDKLGLSTWQPKKYIGFQTSLADIKKSKRMDAEYFHPKYLELIEKIKTFDLTPLNDLVSYSKGIEPGSDAYIEDGGYPFVRVSDVSINGFLNVEKKISKELFEELKETYMPKKGELLFTKDGTIGITFPVFDEKDIIISGAFLRLKPKRQDVELEYLTLVLNSLVCKMQIEQIAGGAIILHLKPSDAMRLQLPLLKKGDRKKLGTQVTQSRRILKQSEQLFETAKDAVTIAIEKGEKEAISFIKATTPKS